MTNNISKSTTSISEDILFTASNWQARLWSETATEEDHYACQQWRQADPLHEEAWQLLNGLNQQFDHVPKSQQQILFKKDRMHISDWLKKGSTFAIIFGLITYGYHHKLLNIWMADYQTKTGEIKTFTLEDGTQLVLASNSAVNFDQAKHRLDLLKGQIFVKTGHKSTHQTPLYVHSTNTTIQPLGTQFTVQQSSASLSIAVYEGAVRITAPSLDFSIHLKSDWQVQFNPEQPAPHYQKVNPLQLAWIQHKLVVEQMPLCDFLEEVANYHVGYISCTKDLQQLKISGTYSLNDPKKIFEQLHQTLPIQIQTYSDYFVVIKYNK